MKEPESTGSYQKTENRPTLVKAQVPPPTYMLVEIHGWVPPPNIVQPRKVGHLNNKEVQQPTCKLFDKVTSYSSERKEDVRSI